jgi:hypothetical protein
MNICIKEIKKHLENQDFFKTKIFKNIVEIIKDYNKNCGNQYFTKNFDDYIFTKKTIQKYEKELLTILNYIFDNYGDAFFIAEKNKNALFFTNHSEFCINGYENFNSKLKYETALTLA